MVILSHESPFCTIGRGYISVLVDIVMPSQRLTRPIDTVREWVSAYDTPSVAVESKSRSVTQITDSYLVMVLFHSRRNCGILRICGLMASM